MNNRRSVGHEVQQCQLLLGKGCIEAAVDSLLVHEAEARDELPRVSGYVF